MVWLIFVCFLEVNKSITPGQLFHAISRETMSRLQKKTNKTYFGIQPGVSFIYSSQQLNQISVRHQDKVIWTRINKKENNKDC